MEKMGFSSKWIGWVKESVETVSYSVQIDGQPCGFFKPSRGLRQGDPISPNLFLLRAEGLACLLNSAEQRGDISGIQIARRCPSITHLLFSDDSYQFGEASERECRKLL